MDLITLPVSTDPEELLAALWEAALDEAIVNLAHEVSTTVRHEASIIERH